MSRLLRIKGTAQVKGQLIVPGDKSISHRAAMLASVASGPSRISGFATSADCRSTLGCLERLGVRIERSQSEIIIHGAGLGGYQSDADIVHLDAGNSGSTIRMLSGLLAGQSLTTIIDGDESLRRRPMRRIIEPLTLMGANIDAREGTYAPLRIRGGNLKAINYTSRVASAQVKSCVLFAGLAATGRTVFTEPALSRNHSELMLKVFGAQIEVDESLNRVGIEGGKALTPVDYHVPGDVSSAAFFIAAATILPDSEIVLPNVCLNPTRAAFVEVLNALGAQIHKENVRTRHGEMVGDLRVTSGDLRTEGRGLILSGEIIPNLIDEIPILAVVGSQVEGRIEVRDAKELRIKESDRIRTVVEAMRALGGRIEEFEDGFAIDGPQRLAGGRVETAGDHRIAMAFSIAALAACGETEIVDADCAAISFPEFYRSLRELTGQEAIE
ncbi:MAG TPA: 3-phosphoshikimate 1-carboxyvinyltransferase [Blastocatellia bacterium]|nr:3-phosphoshikimate 1-carboxyvinyltransferase [Blastocatellia bacterium]